MHQGHVSKQVPTILSFHVPPTSIPILTPSHQVSCGDRRGALGRGAVFQLISLHHQVRLQVALEREADVTHRLTRRELVVVLVKRVHVTGGDHTQCPDLAEGGKEVRGQTCPFTVNEGDHKQRAGLEEKVNVRR